MGKRGKGQRPMWVAADVTRGPGRPFYEALNRLVGEHGFDEFVEDRCRCFYTDCVGRPSLAPVVYFRLLLIGYFEGFDTTRTRESPR